MWAAGGTSDDRRRVMSIANNVVSSAADRDYARTNGLHLVTIDVTSDFVKDNSSRGYPRITYQGCMSPEKALRIMALIKECLPPPDQIVLKDWCPPRPLVRIRCRTRPGRPLPGPGLGSPAAGVRVRAGGGSPAAEWTRGSPDGCRICRSDPTGTDRSRMDPGSSRSSGRSRRPLSLP